MTAGDDAVTSTPWDSSADQSWLRRRKEASQQLHVGTSHHPLLLLARGE